MSFDLKPRIIKEIQTIAHKYAIDKIVLFGSRARGDNTPKSDIDIAVYTLLDFKNEGHFVSEIEDMYTLLKIDMVFINKDTDERLLNNIDKEGVIIYERLQTKI